MEKRFIYVLSEENAGTMLTSIILATHPDVGWFSYDTEVLAHATKGYRWAEGGPPIENAPNGWLQMSDGLGDPAAVIQSHFFYEGGRKTGRIMRESERVSAPQIITMLVGDPVIPIRDIGRVLVTWEDRIKKDKAGHTISEAASRWSSMIKTVNDLGDHLNACFFPIDLLKDDQSKREHIHRLLKHVALDPVDHTELWATCWSIVYSHGESDLRRRYDGGDMDNVKRSSPEIWGALKKHEPIFRPFFEARGYEALPWYS